MALTSLTNLQPLHVHSVGVSTFDGSVSVGGTLTYEDVTNVDAIGIITARSGVNVSGGQLDVGSSIKLGNAGVITATSFVGSGANLTGLPSQVTIANNADNRVITGGSGTNLNGEANLTFNGTTLDLNGTANILKSDSSGFHVLIRNTNNTNGNQAELRFQGTNSVNGGYTTARIVATNLDNYNQYSDLRFFTHSLGSTTEKLRITSGGLVGIGTVPASGTTLDIDASGGGVLALRRNSVSTNNKITLSSDGTDGTLESTNNIIFRAGGDERFRCQGSAAGLVMQNDCYIEIPHDQRCIVFDGGQKMITSNDGQGNFNIIAGKNHNGQHVDSPTNGQSGISQIELSCDGVNGSINFAVGPRRSAGSSANFDSGFKMVRYAPTSDDYLNGLKYITGSNASPSGLATQYNVIHAGNARTGRWSANSSDQVFKVLGDGGSVALTTNDGGGNANVTFNHASEISDTAGSCWRIRADIDNVNSHFYIQNNTNVSSGQNNIAMSNRLEIAQNGTFYGSSSNNISDQRLKKNIATITDATTKIKGLIGRTFEWKDEAQLETGTQYGFIAQEMETVVSDLVTDGTKAGLRSFDKDGNLLSDNYSEKDKIAEYSKGVNIDGVVPILVEALKEAITKIETLETKVAALEGS